MTLVCPRDPRDLKLCLLMLGHTCTTDISRRLSVVFSAAVIPSLASHHSYSQTHWVYLESERRPPFSFSSIPRLKEYFLHLRGRGENRLQIFVHYVSTHLIFPHSGTQNPESLTLYFCLLPCQTLPLKQPSGWILGEQ